MYRCQYYDETHATTTDRDRCCGPVTGRKAVLLIGGIVIVAITGAGIAALLGAQIFLGLIASMP